MASPRVRPYRTFAISPDGERTPLRAHGLVLERPLGPSLEVNLAPHPAFRGLVAFMTDATLLLEPAAGNVLFMFLESYPQASRRRGTRRSARTPHHHVYLVDSTGKKRAIPDRIFAIDPGNGLELTLNFTPTAPWAQHVCVEAFGAPLAVLLNSGNIVQVAGDEKRRFPAKQMAKLRGAAPFSTWQV